MSRTRVVEPTKAPVQTTEPTSKGDIVACIDRQGYTCIQVLRTEKRVKYIPINTTGMRVEEISVTQFDSRYKPIDGYPVVKACRQYADMCLNYGADKETLDFLGQVVDLKQEEHEMAAKKTEAKKVKAEKSGKKVSSEKRETAAGLFKKLIMEGKHTDDAIFAQVQKKFDLDDGRRSYVSWYRNSLKKAGENPPEPK